MFHEIQSFIPYVDYEFHVIGVNKLGRGPFMSTTLVYGKKADGCLMNDTSFWIFVLMSMLAVIVIAITSISIRKCVQHSKATNDNSSNNSNHVTSLNGFNLDDVTFQQTIEKFTGLNFHFEEGTSCTSHNPLKHQNLEIYENVQ